MKKPHTTHPGQFDAALDELLRALRPLLLLGLVAAVLFASMRQTTTKVSIDVLVSSLTWQDAEPPGTDPEWVGLELAARSHGPFALPAATVTSHRVPPNQPLVLQPLPPFRPVRVHLLALPAQADMQLTQADTTRLQLVVSPTQPPDSAALLSWRVELGGCQYLNPATLRPQPLCAATTSDGPPCVLTMQRDLRSGQSYTFEFVQAGSWKAPARLVATALRFAEANVRQTTAISSVLSGRVKLLETSDAPLELAERDVLDVQFEQPVELYLKGTPAGIQVHLDGEANRLLCGPRIMGEANNQLPRRLKSLYDKAPYLSVLATLLLSLLAIDRFWKKPKSI